MGSAIKGAQWLPEAVEYARAQQKALAGVPVALFCVHIMNLGSDEKSAKNRLAYLDAVRPLAKPVDEAFFAGKADVESQPWLARFVYHAFKIGPEGDARH